MSATGGSTAECVSRANARRLVAAAAVCVVATSLLTACSSSGSTPSGSVIPNPKATSQPAVPASPSSTPMTSSTSVVVEPSSPVGLWFPGIIAPAGHKFAPVKSIRAKRNPDGSYQPVQPPEATDLDLRTASWRIDRATPGTTTTKTVEFDGHACPKNYPCAFNHLKDLRLGDPVVVQTKSGYELRYELAVIDPPANPFKLNKRARNSSDLASMQHTNQIGFNAPGRLLLITCGYKHGDTSTYNWVAVAYLVSARKL